MKKIIYSRIIALIMILTVLPFASTYANNTIFVVDGSGSVAGLSKNRPRNSIKLITSELTDYLSKLSSLDTVSLIHFTDRIEGIHTYAGYSSSLQSVIDSLRFIPKGNTSFKVALDAVDAIPNHQRIVILSDGLNNTGISNHEICERLSTLSERCDVYFLLLDEIDKYNTIIQYAQEAGNIQLVNSLSDIPPTSSNYSNADLMHETYTLDKEQSIDESNTLVSDSKEKTCLAFEWKYLKVILMVLGIILLLLLVGYFIYKLLPLFAKASAGAMQKSIFVLYSLPKGLFNFVFKVLPANVKSFLSEIMPSRDNFNKGIVLPKNEQQKKVLNDMRKEAGKAIKYKNGEIDFSPVSKFKVKLRGSLDKNIPETLEPRSKVFKAQEAARDQMLNSRKGRKTIGKYCGKSLKDVTIDDYTCWKDDMRNFGTSNHNPLTPHETIDGKYIQWVPKKYHDVSCGGISHSGGVSLLKSIRNFLAQ